MWKNPRYYKEYAIYITKTRLWIIKYIFWHFEFILQCDTNISFVFWSRNYVFTHVSQSVVLYDKHHNDVSLSKYLFFLWKEWSNSLKKMNVCLSVQVNQISPRIFLLLLFTYRQNQRYGISFYQIVMFISPR